MTRLTVTAGGQVTFHEEVLRHLGIQPGEAVELDLLPDGRAELRAQRPKHAVRELGGFLKGKTKGASLTIEDIKVATEEAWARAGAGDE